MLSLAVEPPYDDEQNCECSEDEFQCDFGMCVHKSKFCDGFEDCIDGSDERDNCSTLPSTHIKIFNILSFLKPSFFSLFQRLSVPVSRWPMYFAGEVL